MTTRLRDVLQDPPHDLHVAVLSIDDLYLPHTRLVDVAASHPHNPLLSGRGQPGTHDVPLGTKLLQNLKRINDPDFEDAKVQNPFFDKSLFDGQGDRVEKGETYYRPIDVVLFEGWCVGFCPVPLEEVDSRYDEPIPDLKDILDIRSFGKDNIHEINENLWKYVEWWSFFDSFIQACASSF